MFEMDEIYERMSEFATLQYNQRGTYVLVMQCRRAVKVQIGQLSNMCMEIGWYLYIGSAFGSGGLKARVGRHLREQKKKHWHIDYLLPNITVREIWYRCANRKLEHHWADAILSQPNSAIPVLGFGSSDCNCKTHLVYFRHRMNVEAARERLSPHIWLLSS